MVVDEDTPMTDPQQAALSELSVCFLDPPRKAEAVWQGEQLRKAVLGSVIHETAYTADFYQGSVTTLLQHR